MSNVVIKKIVDASGTLAESSDKLFEVTPVQSADKDALVGLINGLSCVHHKAISAVADKSKINKKENSSKNKNDCGWFCSI